MAKENTYSHEKTGNTESSYRKSIHKSSFRPPPRLGAKASRVGVWGPGQD